MNNLSLLYSLIRKLVSQVSGVIQEYFPFQVLSSMNTLNPCIAVKLNMQHVMQTTYA
jgi:hypothetical protein